MYAVKIFGKWVFFCFSSFKSQVLSSRYNIVNVWSVLMHESVYGVAKRQKAHYQGWEETERNVMGSQ